LKCNLETRSLFPKSAIAHKSLEAVLLIVLAPLGASAQAVGPVSPIMEGPIPYGSGEQPLLNYADEAAPENMLGVSLDTDTAYDSNILSTRKGLGEVTASLGPRVAFLHRHRNFNLDLDYQAYALLYGRTTEFNSVNHIVNFDSSYQVSRHFALRFRNAFSYENYPIGIFEPHSSREFVPVLGSPTSLNATVVTPLARTERYDGRLDALCQISGRSSLDFYGGFLDQKFAHRATPAALFGVEGADGGVGYLYRLTQTSTFGADYVLQNFSFAAAHARMVIHGMLFSYAQRLSPTVAFSVFGGPQFSRFHDSFIAEVPFLFFVLNVPVRIARGDWYPAFGGAFIKQSSKTVFQISGQRLVSDGGGFSRAAINSSVDLNVRRRLTGRWNAIATADYARTSALSGGLFKSDVRYASAGVGLERSLTERLTGRVAYNYLNQRSGGQIPLQADLDRSRVSVGLFYEVGNIPLGR
jgi:hypothetical protein